MYIILLYLKKNKILLTESYFCTGITITCDIFYPNKCTVCDNSSEFHMLTNKLRKKIIRYIIHP